MLGTFHPSVLALIAACGFASQASFAESPKEFLSSLQTEATSTPGFQGFSSARGEKFFQTRHGNEWSCASCHTENPSAPGKHAKTGKDIAPLAPSANAERFTNPKKVDKWFKRNCNDVLDRLCSAQEKGDVISYLLTFKK